MANISCCNSALELHGRWVNARTNESILSNFLKLFEIELEFLDKIPLLIVADCFD